MKTQQQPKDTIQRSVLPIPDRKAVGLTTYDAKDANTKFPPITPLRPPTGAPNVLVILLDDVGFGASSAFGGPCQTPTAERLAREGLKYNRFHTTALCSPSRAALLTGRNHHTVGMGSITEMATSAPGYNSLRPNTCAPLAEILKLNGYSTAQFGKCHEVPVFEATPIGPFKHWPTGSGFEHFYGFIGGENNQYYPELYDGTTPIEPERTPEDWLNAEDFEDARTRPCTRYTLGRAGPGQRESGRVIRAEPLEGRRRPFEVEEVERCHLMVSTELEIPGRHRHQSIGVAMR